MPRVLDLTDVFQLIVDTLNQRPLPEQEFSIIGISLFFLFRFSLVGIVDEAELGFLGTSARAADVSGSIHPASSRDRVRVALSNECRMRMTQIILVCQRHGSWLSGAVCGVLVQLIAGLNVILRGGGSCAARIV